MKTSKISLHNLGHNSLSFTIQILVAQKTYYAKTNQSAVGMKRKEEEETET